MTTARDAAPSGGELGGRVALVTGGASGIGLATARTMAREGARVAVADLDPDAGAAAAAAIAADGGEAIALDVDVADEDRVARMVRAVEERLGPVTALANVAAITDRAHQARDRGVLDADPEVWRATLGVDLIGAMLVAKYVLPGMIAAGGGAVVNVSSNSSLQGEVALTAYAAAKAGMNSLTRSIAAAYGKQGVRANTVSPGIIAGPSFTANVPPQVASIMREHVLMPDMGTPQDVAEAIAFLSSDRARYITGQLLCVDGGVSSHVPFLVDIRRMGGSIVAQDEAPRS